MDMFTVLMEHRITVRGPQTTATDAGGGTQLTWPTTRSSDVACIINAPMANDTDRFSGDNLIGTVTIATFYTGASDGDQIEVTAGPTYVGLKFKVTGLKVQPGVAFLGFEPIVHIACEIIV
jgi:hypothetical protein